MTLALLLVASVLLPAGAQATPDPPPGYAIFKVKASHGYELNVFAFASSDGEGSVALFASSPRAAAIYRTPATVTDQRIEADLGVLGQISVKRVRTGRTKSVRDSCRGDRRRRIEAIRYEGTIEFHGEEDFSEASATGAPFDWATYMAFACASEGGHPAGRQLPGARLDVHRLPEENELMLHATQDRPGARTEVSVQVDEVRGELEITRAIGLRTGPDALRFDPKLRTATLAPPAPFKGHASFRRNAPPAARWTGNLTVDLPGYSDYPLIGPRIHAELEHPRA